MAGRQSLIAEYDAPKIARWRAHAGIVSGSELESRVYRDVWSIENEWRSLAARAERSTFYQSFEWCASWVRACEQAGKPERIRIVTVWENGRLVLLWPLALSRFGPTGILHALAEPATQYCDLVVQSSGDVVHWREKAFAAVLRIPGADVLHLKHVRDDSVARALVAERGKWCCISTEEAPYIRFGDVDGMNAGSGRRARSGRTLNALRRHWKNLEQHGPVTYEAVCPSLQVAAVAEALALKDLWLQEKGIVSAGYQHCGNRRTIMSLASSQRFSVFRLSVGSQTAAIEVGIVDRGHYYSMIQSYDRRFAPHAPGRLLFWKLLETGCHGVATFDFLAPAHPHKSEWTDLAIGVCDFAVPLSLKGQLAVAYLTKYRQKFREAFNASPAWLRRRAAGIVATLY